MPYLTARFLDRANEWVVRHRLAGRLPAYAGESAGEYLRLLGEAVHLSPEACTPLEPQQVAGYSWQADSPWPEGEGRNAVWSAEHRPAATGNAPPTGRPALILLHGWLIDRPQLLIYRSWARRVAARGIDVWMPWLPHHMQRTEPGEVSGQRCLSPDLRTSLDAVRQAVLEARSLARWLRRRGATRVGLWGMSLGAWVAALAATLDADWEAVALWAPVAAPAEVLLESGLVELLRSAILAGGSSPDDFIAPEISVMTPVSRRPLIPRSRVLVVAGAYDQVVSPRSISRLARHWNIDVFWVPHGHISLMASRAPVTRTAAFLARTLAPGSS